MSKVIVLGDGAFGRSLVHEDKALINGISALIKETPQSSLVPFTISGHNRQSTVCNPEKNFHKNMTLLEADLGLLISRTMRNK